MTLRRPAHSASRRALITASIAMAVTAILPCAHSAEPILKLPASILYLRLNENGSQHPSPEEQRIWDQFAQNLGGVISRIEPVPDNKLLAGSTYSSSGTGAVILAARMAGQQNGYDYVIVYGVLPEIKETPTTSKKGRISKIVMGVRRRLTFWKHEADKNDLVYDPNTKEAKEKPAAHSPLLGEAHLISVHGGNPFASSWADADERNLWQRWTSKDERDDAIISNLADGLERKVYALSSQNFEISRSLAD